MGLKLISPKVIEIDNVLRLEEDFPGLMKTCFTQMLAWVELTFGDFEMRAQVISTNERAIDFYQFFGFKVGNVVSLRGENSHDGVSSFFDCSEELSNTDITKVIMIRDRF